jgi:hypothetical protein
MGILSFAVSLLGGGLAGGCLSIWYQHRKRIRDLRTQFYPKLNNIHSAYLIRMEKKEGRYWTTIVGNVPSNEDAEFVDHRAQFLSDLIQFNELDEARRLRQTMLDNAMKGHHTPGLLTKVDLKPEAEALGKCMQILHLELKLDPMV